MHDEELMSVIVRFALYLVAIKAITIGSKFSFWSWVCHGKDYLRWYHENTNELYVPPIKVEEKK